MHDPTQPILLTEPARSLVACFLLEASEQVRHLEQAALHLEEALNTMAEDLCKGHTMDSAQVPRIQEDIQALAETVQNVEDPISGLMKLIYSGQSYRSFT